MNNEQKPLSDRDDLGSDETRCTECGGPIMYGSRHHHCGTVAMKYQKQLAALQAKNETLRTELEKAKQLLAIACNYLQEHWDMNSVPLCHIRDAAAKEKDDG